MASSKFVSRGGDKLQAALKQFQVDAQGKIILDVVSSTGGFVDCLLQNGALKIYAVDTCYGELAWKLRNDSRIVVMERTNVLHLEKLPSQNTQNTSGVGFDSPDVNKVDLITIDAGWTRLELVLPVVKKFLKPDGQIIALLKPHYEVEKKDLIKGILPPEKAENVKDEVLKKIVNYQLFTAHCIESPILGGGGNQEYLLHLEVKR